MFGDWLTQLDRAEQNIPDRPLSLFEGIAGAVHFLHDLTQDPKTAKFPCLMIWIKHLTMNIVVNHENNLFTSRVISSN